MKSFLSALRFLTVFILPSPRDETAEMAGRSTVWFPVAGLVIGLILAGLHQVFSLFLPLAVANGLTIVSLVLITGAMHLDGLADTCDGLSGNKPAEERWKVMHDSRTGAFGVVGLILLLVMKFILLNSIPRAMITPVIILFPLIGRWAMAYAISSFPYAHKEGLGKAFKDAASRPRLIIATVVTIVLTTGLTWWAGLDYYYIAGIVLFAVVWLFVFAVAVYFRRKFAGLTGDTYGAINELAETFTLLAVPIVLNGLFT
ncbi:MAG: adenosylcobinamide-GDP ribazoletransferase [Dehalococcoidales bacterium]|nr:adenosylcobinamide-GDP ribazoletransferase [Dehalococcoidales bacterium]